MIFADDLGWADTSLDGNGFYETPNLDALAREGTRYTSAYAAAPVCSPSRAALLTGKNPVDTGVTEHLRARPFAPGARPLIPPENAPGLAAAELTIAERLQARGYATYLIGKWHVGTGALGPTHQGFDHVVGANAFGQPGSYFFPYSRNAIGIPDLAANGRPGEYLTDRLTAEAERAIRAAPADRPYFLYLAHYAPHIPLEAPPALVEKYRRKQAAEPRFARYNPVYAAMVESLDGSIGRVIASASAANRGRPLLVLFASDNGGLADAEGPLPHGATTNAPLRHGKGWTLEGGLRVPTIVRWPGRLPAGARNDTPIVTQDLTATMLDAAGLSRPKDIEGFSLAGASERFVGRVMVWHSPHYSNQGGTPATAMRIGRYKLIRFYEDGHEELYDLVADPAESTNIAWSRPDVLARLRPRLDQWLIEHHARLPTPNPAAARR